MGTPRPEDEIDPAEIEEIVAGGGLDGAGSDEPIDAAMAPVVESGGGVAEGFEQSEAALVEAATLGPPDGAELPEEDVPAPEAEPDRAVYGDADHERHPGDETADG